VALAGHCDLPDFAAAGIAAHRYYVAVGAIWYFIKKTFSFRIRRPGELFTSWWRFSFFLVIDFLASAAGVTPLESSPTTRKTVAARPGVAAALRYRQFIFVVLFKTLSGRWKDEICVG